jgi:putative transposase
MRQIDELHLEHPFMGARILRDQLVQLGHKVGGKHMASLMRRMGIATIASQLGTSQRCPGRKIYPYLLRNTCISQANQLGGLDTAYIHMNKGVVHLTAVVDVASRKVLSHRVAITLEAQHAVTALKEAAAQYSSPGIVNTDQGSQLTAQDFVDAVHGADAKLSRDRRGAWRDNVFVERLWRSVKCERVYISRAMTASARPRPLSLSI